MLISVVIKAFKTDIHKKEPYIECLTFLNNGSTEARCTVQLIERLVTEGDTGGGGEGGGVYPHPAKLVL